MSRAKFKISFYDSKGNFLPPVLRYVVKVEYALRWAGSSRNYRNWKYANIWSYDELIESISR